MISVLILKLRLYETNEISESTEIVFGIIL